MGIKDYMIATSIHCVINLRLSGKICPHCKEKADYPKDDLKALGLTEAQIKNNIFYKGKGCGECGGTGLLGRIAIIEIFENSKNIHDSILRGFDRKELINIAKKDRVYHTLTEDALKKFMNGDIDFDEVRRYII